MFNQPGDTMKKLFSALLLAIFAVSAIAATTVPPQLINPTGSTAGQAIVSNGSGSAPTWQAVPLTGLATQAANTVLANPTGSAAVPVAHAVPSCSTANSALKYTSGTGLSCGTTFALTSGNLSQFASTTSSQLLGVLSDETGSGVAVFGTSPTITTPNIVGTATNNNAAAGSVGEFLSNSTTGTNLPNNTNTNATSVSLTAGDWTCNGVVGVNPAGSTTLQNIQAGISTTSATMPTAIGGRTIFGPAGGAGAASALPAPSTRISLSATTTVYLVAFAGVNVSTATVDGFIGCRRPR